MDSVFIVCQLCGEVVGWVKDRLDVNPIPLEVTVSRNAVWTLLLS